MSNSLSAVIVNWNSKEDLKKCLASLRRSGVDAETIVIDNGSHDGCGHMLSRDYPDIRFIQSDRNLGFAAANNLAAHQASGSILLFLNPDTEVVEGAVDTMLAHLLSLPDAGIVGCKLLNSDGTVQSSCIQSIPTIANQILDSEFLRRRWPQSPLWGTSPLHAQGDTPREIAVVSGACLMISRRVFEQVGGFSDDYFMYAEDVDLAHKVRGAGYRNYYVPCATVVHHGGSSSAHAGTTFSAVMRREAIWQFLRKARGQPYAFAYRGAIAAAAAARLTALALPLLLRGSGPNPASARRWLAVLGWAMGRDGLVKRYRAASPAVDTPRADVRSQADPGFTSRQA